jgi:hypothetical protein
LATVSDDSWGFSVYFFGCDLEGLVAMLKRSAVLPWTQRTVRSLPWT